VKWNLWIDIFLPFIIKDIKQFSKSSGCFSMFLESIISQSFEFINYFSLNFVYMLFKGIISF